MLLDADVAGELGVVGDGERRLRDGDGDALVLGALEDGCSADPVVLAEQAVSNAEPSTTAAAHSHPAACRVTASECRSRLRRAGPPRSQASRKYRAQM